MKQPPKYKVGDKVTKKDFVAQVLGEIIPYGVVRDAIYTRTGGWLYHVIFTAVKINQEYGFHFYETDMEPYDDEVDTAFKMLHEEAERKIDGKI